MKEINSLVVHFLLLMLSIYTVQSEVKCGERKVVQQELIFQGNQVRLGKWPWHAGLFHSVDKNKPVYVCGGTIISSTFILTAAHCTFTGIDARKLVPAEMVVRVGMIMLNKNSFQESDIAQIIRNPEYEYGSFDSDIALLKLASMLEMTNYVIPICLWDGSDQLSVDVGQNGSVAGWGQDENVTTPVQLKDAIMPIVSKKDCQESDMHFYMNFLFFDKNFCAGFRNGTSVGPGDSGGGLYIYVNRKWMLRGIVKNGKFNQLHELDTKSYVVFTDVAYYLKWIKKNMRIRKKTSTEDIRQDVAVCGKKSNSLPTNRLKNTSLWPWQGHVLKRTESWTRLCDVVIISDSILLSPAHVYTTEFVGNCSGLKVEFRNDRGAITLERCVKKLIRHHGFSRRSLENNIAILEVKKKITYTPLIQPICFEKSLPTTEISGSMDFIGQFQAPLMDYQFCENDFPTQASLIKEQLTCYKLVMQKGFKRPADFVYYHDHKSWYLRGIAINTNKSYSLNIVHVLMIEVTYFKDWIEEKVNLLGIDNCSRRNLDDWNLSIYSNNKHQCFATPISPLLLLTTATCVDGIPLESLSVVKEDDEGEKININKIHLHPLFENQTLTNNIAVLELKTPFGGIGICLPGNLAKDLWQLQLQVPTLNDTLPFVDFDRIDTEDCVRELQDNVTYVATDGSHICGLVVPDIEKKIEFQCSMHFYGAPLLYATNNASNVYLRGILDISKNNHCNDFDTPKVYLDVMHYADWIRKVAQEISEHLQSLDYDYRAESWSAMMDNFLE